MNLETAIHKIYANFFNEIGGVCTKTGIISACPDKRFATYPYIGSEYDQEGIPKLLFIGTDIGADQTVFDSCGSYPCDPSGRLQSFEERRVRVMDRIENPGRNRHIPGTYSVALGVLHSNCPDWSRYWDECREMSVSGLMKANAKDFYSAKYPLSYVALTNFHKFVTVHRRNFSGGKNRNFIWPELECQLLVDEVAAFNPDIVIFQSVDYRQKIKDSELEYRGLDYRHIKFHDIEGIFTGDRVVLMGPHPSVREKDYPGCSTAQGLMQWIRPWNPVN